MNGFEKPFLAALLGTSVEYFETVVIAYAIIRAGYPREAISATVLGHVLVFIAAIFIWPVHQLIPIFWFRLAAAAMLTLMGIWWTLKSARRLLTHQRPRWVEDPLGKVGVTAKPGIVVFSGLVFLIMLKSSVIEALEILLVIFPVAASHLTWLPVLAGSATGIIAVTLIALLLHGQLRRVPEVKVKLATGLLLLLIGLSWIAELWPSP